MGYPRVFNWEDGGFTGAEGDAPTYLYEVTFRAVDGQYLYAPDDPEIAPLVAGCIARAARKLSVRVHAVHLLANHGSILASFRSSAEQVEFRKYAFGWMNREVNRRRNRSGTIFGRRSRPIQVVGDEAAVDRLAQIYGVLMLSFLPGGTFGPIFAGWVHAWLMPATAVGLLLLAISGLYLWLQPIWRRSRRPRDRA